MQTTQPTPAQARTEYIRAKMADVPERWLRHMPQTADAAELERCERLIRGEMASHAKRQRGHAAGRMQRAWDGARE